MKRNYVVALSTIVLLVAGVVVASNMGFKLNKVINGQGDDIGGGLLSNSGTQDIALPFNQQTSITMASHLRTDIINAGECFKPFRTAGG